VLLLNNQSKSKGRTERINIVNSKEATIFLYLSILGMMMMVSDLGITALQVVLQHWMLPHPHLTSNTVTQMLENRLPKLRESIISNKQKMIDNDECVRPPKSDWKIELENKLTNQIGFIDQTQISDFLFDLQDSCIESIMMEATYDYEEREDDDSFTVSCWF
jgi:hypothetical protein